MSNEPVTLGVHNGFEVYPMPMFVTMAVDDPAAVADWYVDALGFGIMFRGPVLHLRRRKYQDILLVQATPERPASGGGPAVSFDVDDDVAGLAERARAAAPRGRAAIEAPVDTPWNTRELRVIDPAGHRLVFFSRRKEMDPEALARWQKLFDADRKS